jgi:Putative peptidoglycan binding domain
MQVRRMIAAPAAISALVLAGTFASGGAALAAPTAPAAVQNLAVYGCNYAGSPYETIGEYWGSNQPKYVKEAQCLLRFWGFNPGGIDGSFGPNTLAAVEGFQGWLHISCGLAVDGIVGPKTWHALTNPGC